MWRLPTTINLRAPAGLMLSSLLLVACAATPVSMPVATPASPANAPSPASTASDRPAPSDQPTTDSAQAQSPVQITIAAAGDILAHPPVTQSAMALAGNTGGYNYRPLFDEVAPLLSAADLAICHVETPLSLDDTNLSAWNAMDFNTPREMATALAGAGYDACDFASNHTMDRGLAGLAATEQVIREAGMGYTGPTVHQERAGVAEMLDVGGVKVAHLAYTYTYPNAGDPTTIIPADAPWLAEASWPTIDSEGILAQARAARAAGATFVVVSMHWGAEYVTMPTDDQRRIARELLESDAVDLILGTHAHLIQPCEAINGKQVIYGMGNSLSNQGPSQDASLVPATQEGMVATFTLTRNAAGVVTTRMVYQPTRVDIPGHVIRLVTPDSRPETWQRATSAVDLLGGCGAVAVHP